MSKTDDRKQDILPGILPEELILYVMGYSGETNKCVQVSKKYYNEFRYVLLCKKFMSTLPFEMLKYEYSKKHNNYNFSHYWAIYSRNAQQLVALCPWYEKKFEKSFLNFITSFRGNTMPQAVLAIDEYENLVRQSWFELRRNVITASEIAIILT